MKSWSFRKQVILSRALYISASFAAIRCIVELLRLQQIGAHIPANEMTLYLHGLLIASLSVLVMGVLSFYNRYISTPGISICTISVLSIMKFIYIN